MPWVAHQQRNHQHRHHDDRQAPFRAARVCPSSCPTAPAGARPSGRRQTGCRPASRRRGRSPAGRTVDRQQHRDSAAGAGTPVKKLPAQAGRLGSSICTLKRASRSAAQIANTIAAIQPRLPSSFSPPEVENEPGRDTEIEEVLQGCRARRRSATLP
jgi:hypothetical protein